MPRVVDGPYPQRRRMKNVRRARNACCRAGKRMLLPGLLKLGHSDRARAGPLGERPVRVSFSSSSEALSERSSDFRRAYTLCEPGDEESDTSLIVPNSLREDTNSTDPERTSVLRRTRPWKRIKWLASV